MDPTAPSAMQPHNEVFQASGSSLQAAEAPGAVMFFIAKSVGSAVVHASDVITRAHEYMALSDVSNTTKFHAIQLAQACVEDAKRQVHRLAQEVQHGRTSWRSAQAPDSTVQAPDSNDVVLLQLGLDECCRRLCCLLSCAAHASLAPVGHIQQAAIDGLQAPALFPPPDPTIALAPDPGSSVTLPATQTQALAPAHVLGVVPDSASAQASAPVLALISGLVSSPATVAAVAPVARAKTTQGARAATQPATSSIQALAPVSISVPAANTDSPPALSSMLRRQSKRARLNPQAAAHQHSSGQQQLAEQQQPVEQQPTEQEQRIEQQQSAELSTSPTSETLTSIQLPIICSGRKGTFLWPERKVRIDSSAGVQVMECGEFERSTDLRKTKCWKRSIHIRNPDDTAGMPMLKWLQEHQDSAKAKDQGSAKAPERQHLVPTPRATGLRRRAARQGRDQDTNGATQPSGEELQDGGHGGLQRGPPSPLATEAGPCVNEVLERRWVYYIPPGGPPEQPPVLDYSDYLQHTCQQAQMDQVQEPAAAHAHAAHPQPSATATGAAEVSGDGQPMAWEGVDTASPIGSIPSPPPHARARDAMMTGAIPATQSQPSAWQQQPAEGHAEVPQQQDQTAEQEPAALQQQPVPQVGAALPHQQRGRSGAVARQQQPVSLVGAAVPHQQRGSSGAVAQQQQPVSQVGAAVPHQQRGRSGAVAWQQQPVPQVGSHSRSRSAVAAHHQQNPRGMAVAQQQRQAADVNPHVELGRTAVPQAAIDCNLHMDCVGSAGGPMSTMIEEGGKPSKSGASPTVGQPLPSRSLNLKKRDLRPRLASSRAPGSSTVHSLGKGKLQDQVGGVDRQVHPTETYGVLAAHSNGAQGKTVDGQVPPVKTHQKSKRAHTREEEGPDEPVAARLCVESQRPHKATDAAVPPLSLSVDLASDRIRLPIICKDLKGTFLWPEWKIRDDSSANPDIVDCQEFEKRAGKQKTKYWKRSTCVRNPDGSAGVQMKEWLHQNGLSESRQKGRKRKGAPCIAT